MQHHISDIQRAFSELDRVIKMATEANLIVSKRSVSKMAKNICHGDKVDLPDFGPTVISEWSRTGDTVILGDGAGRRASVSAEKRLTVRGA